VTPLAIGTTATYTKTIKAEDLRLFAELSGDRNPIHLDPAFAATTIFKRCIAHGMYVGSFISAAIASQLPGEGSIYLGQEMSFRKPVFVDDTVTVTLTILDTPKPTLYSLSTVVTNQKNEVVIEGKALVKKS